MTGTLKMVSSAGYGFIQHNHIDFFFHHTQYEGNWAELTKFYITSKDESKEIELEFENDPKAPEGPRAKNVRLKAN